VFCCSVGRVLFEAGGVAGCVAVTAAISGGMMNVFRQSLRLLAFSLSQSHEECSKSPPQVDGYLFEPRPRTKSILCFLCFLDAYLADVDFPVVSCSHRMSINRPRSLLAHDGLHTCKSPFHLDVPSASSKLSSHYTTLHLVFRQRLRPRVLS